MTEKDIFKERLTDNNRYVIDISPCLIFKAYRRGVAVWFLPIKYPLPKGKPVEARQSVTTSNFAISTQSFGRAASIPTGVKARRVFRQSWRWHLTRLITVQHRITSVQKRRIVRDSPRRRRPTDRRFYSVALCTGGAVLIFGRHFFTISRDFYSTRFFLSFSPISKHSLLYFQFPYFSY